MSTRCRYIIGWTLVELCIILLLIAIIFTMAVPSWQRHIQYKQLKIIQQKLRNAINYARTVALSNQQHVALCSSDDNWKNGFRAVLSNPKHNCQQSVLLRQWKIKDINNLRIKWHGFDNKQLFFTPQPEYWAINGRFTISYGSDGTVELIVNRLGRVTLR